MEMIWKVDMRRFFLDKLVKATLGKSRQGRDAIWRRGHKVNWYLDHWTGRQMIGRMCLNEKVNEREKGGGSR